MACSGPRPAPIRRKDDMQRPAPVCAADVPATVEHAATGRWWWRRPCCCGELHRYRSQARPAHAPATTSGGGEFGRRESLWRLDLGMRRPHQWTTPSTTWPAPAGWHQHTIKSYFWCCERSGAPANRRNVLHSTSHSYALSCAFSSDRARSQDKASYESQLKHMRLGRFRPPEATDV